MKSKVAVLLLLMTLILSTAPTLVFAAEDNNTTDQSSEDAIDTQLNADKFAVRAQRMLEIANRTAMRIEYFIEKNYNNTGLIDVLNRTGRLNAFEGNVTLFEDARSLLTNASIAIDSGNYTNAIMYITEAMKTFKEVYRSLYAIVEDHVPALGNRLIARGLIIAMQQAQKRIDRIRNMTGDDENITSLLDEAEEYLNITAAYEMLEEGNVTGVSHNLVKANKLINKAYLLLKGNAEKEIWGRVENYLNGIERAYGKIEKRIELAKKMGINVTALFGELGYRNQTEFREVLQKLIMKARSKASDIKEALRELHKISQNFWKMDWNLMRHMRRYQWEHNELGGQGQNQSHNHNETQNKPRGIGGGIGKGSEHSEHGKHGKP